MSDVFTGLSAFHSETGAYGVIVRSKDNGTGTGLKKKQCLQSAAGIASFLIMKLCVIYRGVLSNVRVFLYRDSDGR